MKGWYFEERERRFQAKKHEILMLIGELEAKMIKLPGKRSAETQRIFHKFLKHMRSNNEW